MLKFEEICELVRLVGSTGVARVEIEHGGSRVEIKGRPQPQMVVASTDGTEAGRSPQVVFGTPAPSEAVESSEGDAGSGDQHVVESPIVGTFYRAPSPEAEPFIKVGDQVRSGQVLCIVEAMKLMNEIPCDVDGTVTEIHVENTEPVGYGQPLFSIRPS